MQEGLERYHEKSWGRRVKDLPQTLTRHPDSNGKLVETGARKALMTKSDAPGAIRTVTPRRIVYGTSNLAGVYANWGIKHEARKPVLKLNAPVRALIKTIIRDRITHTGDDA